MNNKIKISLFVLLIIGIIGINILYKNKSNIPRPKSNLAIMIDENGDGNYTNSTSIPIGSYVLNEEKTVCENGGKVKSYNNSTGQIGFSFLGSDRCSLYFEKVEKPTISNVSLNGNNLSASFNSKKSLCCYAITTSTSEPSDWTNINGSSYTLNTSLTNSGTYYLWLKDSYGNVTKYRDGIVVNISKGWETILLNNGNGAATVENAKSYIEGKGTPDFNTISTTNDGMYAAEDDLGKSYYFRGAVDNNWVEFGKDSSGSDIYWRIIRINGDGSIRMIYSGTTAPTSNTAVVMTGKGTQINEATYAYNEEYDKTEYVGYMYTIGEQHGYGTSSIAKNQIDEWYKKTTMNTDNSIKKLVSDQPFCGDRSVTLDTSVTPGEISDWQSTGVYYDYGAFIRLSKNKNPTLICPTSSDKFTVSALNGNGVLTHPIGLITADEMAMAGGSANTGNTEYYLYTNQYNWSISPIYYGSSRANEFTIKDTGRLGNYRVNNTTAADTVGIRPVINLSKEVILTGDGTYNNIYTVS